MRLRLWLRWKLDLSWWLRPRLWRVYGERRGCGRARDRRRDTVRLDVQRTSELRREMRRHGRLLMLWLELLQLLLLLLLMELRHERTAALDLRLEERVETLQGFDVQHYADVRRAGGLLRNVLLLAHEKSDVQNVLDVP